MCSPIDEKTSLNLILTQAALTTWVYGGLLLDKSYFIYRMRFISGLLLVYTLAVLYPYTRAIGPTEIRKKTSSAKVACPCSDQALTVEL